MFMKRYLRKFYRSIVEIFVSDFAISQNNIDLDKTLTIFLRIIDFYSTTGKYVFLMSVCIVSLK